jgi:nitrile hydratase subunit beta
MGGMHGFGPVVTTDGHLTHHDPWEVRAQVVALLSGSGQRAYIEALDPAVYLESSYYVRWFRTSETTLLEQGVVDADELEEWRARFAADPAARPPVVNDPAVAESLRHMVPHRHGPVAGAAFDVGDRVRVRRMRPEHHHRCPRYLRGAVGVVEKVLGNDNVPGLPPEEQTAETCYTVRFASVDLFGERADEPPYVLLIDLWQRYLETPR